MSVAPARSSGCVRVSVSRPSSSRVWSTSVSGLCGSRPSANSAALFQRSQSGLAHGPARVSFVDDAPKDHAESRPRQRPAGQAPAPAAAASEQHRSDRACHACSMPRISRAQSKPMEPRGNSDSFSKKLDRTSSTSSGSTAQ